MDHRVTVGADGTQILDGIKFVFSTYLAERHQMVHLNVSYPNLTIRSLKVEPAYRTAQSVVPDARFAGARISLIGIDADLSGGTLNKGL